MNKRGFTLIELLAVIVVLAIILVIAVPNIIKVIDKTRNDTFTRNESLIISAARNYFYQNSTLLPQNINDSIFVSLSDLINNKLIDNIVDPKDRTNCNIYASGVAITKKSANDYSYQPQLICNNYASSNPLINNITNNYNSGDNTSTINISINNNLYYTKELITPTSTIGLFKPTLTDYSTWVLNTVDASPGNFVKYGHVNENQIMLKTNPWGQNDIVWSTQMNDSITGADGGWVVSNIAIDNTKKYRITVWLRREDVGDGSFYFGCQPSTVGSLSTGAVQTNPYFHASGTPTSTNNWTLLVAYIQPYNYALTTTDPTTGIYDGATKSKITAQINDFKWLSTSTVGGHRTFLNGSTTINEKLYWYRPRFEIVDGNEPTISELLDGKENINLNDYSTINKTGNITYTVTSNGTYDFYIKRNDNSLYKFSYTINNIQ